MSAISIFSTMCSGGDIMQASGFIQFFCVGGVSTCSCKHARKNIQRPTTVDWYVMPPRSVWQGCTRECANQEAGCAHFCVSACSLTLWRSERAILTSVSEQSVRVAKALCLSYFGRLHRLRLPISLSTLSFTDLKIKSKNFRREKCLLKK